MNFSSHNTVMVDLAALRYNFRTIRAGLGPGVRMMAVVKADAYGHGLEPAAGAFAREGADCFGVGVADEGARLRRAGVAGEIVLLLGYDPATAEEVVAAELSPVVFNADGLGELSRLARRRQQVVSVHLKLDTGMGRFGVLPAAAAELVAVIAQLPGLELAGIMAHFPLADEPAGEEVCREQWQSLQVAHESLPPVAGGCRPLLHMANSAAMWRFPWAHGDLVRPGISLYGYSPLADIPMLSAAAALPALRPAMSLLSRVVQVKELPAGCGISYGHRFVTTRPTRLAVLPVGYADGYPRGISGVAQVLLAGCRVPVLGTICMNACLAEVSDLPAVRPGDEAVLLGGQGSEFIGADEMAAWHDTISYEILCRIGAMNRRLYQ